MHTADRSDTSLMVSSKIMQCFSLICARSWMVSDVLKVMIDDLWWYGDTMWYVYIIDIYRYPSVCVCECRSNMFQSSRWLSLNVVRQLKRKIIFFLQFLCRVSHFRSITEFRTSFCMFLLSETSGYLGWWRALWSIRPAFSWSQLPRKLQQLWFLRKLHQAANGRTQWRKIPWPI